MDDTQAAGCAAAGSRERIAPLFRATRGAVLTLVLLGISGCGALPQLPGSAADDSLAAEVVAHAASSVCTGAYAWLETEPTREVRLPGARYLATRGASDGDGGTTIVLSDIRDLPLPRRVPGAVTITGQDAREVIEDPRSGLTDIPQIVDVSVIAADRAYDIREQGGPDGSSGDLDPEIVAREMRGYHVQKFYIDRFSGLKAFVLESESSRHRIYAVAGTQVFTDRDYRDWASGLMMARPQFVSDAGLLLVKDAADYASDPENGGEVFFTGQSQGAVIAQALGFLAQELLNARQRPHRLVHVIAWGATGAAEPLAKTIEDARRGQGRGISPELEAHWRASGADDPRVKPIWATLEAHWSAAVQEPAANYVRRIAQQMHVIGFFFDIDPFARIGTFLGTPLVFPVELVLPQRCEPLVTELVLKTRFGGIGLQLESHFLKGYRRAVGRGAAELAQPARIEQRRWVLGLLPPAEVVGRTWLDNIYLTRLGNDEDNWQRCFASHHWITDRNRDCQHRYWPGCDRDPQHFGRSWQTTDGASWCLISDPPVGDDVDNPLARPASVSVGRAS